MPTVVHETAIVDPSAQLGQDVFVGPYSIVGPNTHIGDRTQINPHVVIQGNVTIGSDCRIHQFTALGCLAQVSNVPSKELAEARLEIGDFNSIREHVVIQLGSPKGGGVTRIGNHNQIHAFSNIGHDCIIDNHTIISAASLAGHVHVMDYVFLGGGAGAHQFCRIGPYAFVGARATLLKDVLPYMITASAKDGQSKLLAPNRIGLERQGFDQETIDLLNKASRLIKTPSAYDVLCEKLQALLDENPNEHLSTLVLFVKEKSDRGLLI